MVSHSIRGEKVQVYRRENSRFWQCSTFLNGKNYRKSTKEESLAKAKEVAEDWYLELRGKARLGLIKTEKTFREASAQFLREYEVITEGQRSKKWAEGHAIRVRLHLDPFFGDMGLSEITAGTVQEYRMHRIVTAKAGKPGKNGEPPKPGKAPSRSTLHDEVVTLRQVLKTAIRHKWLDHLPDLSPPYKTQGKITHRPWFSPEEYKQLYEAARAYAKEPFHAHYKWNAEQVYDFILFMANTGLRPDEAFNLQHRDVTIAHDDATGEEILEIEVRGKRGVGHCKSMPGAVRVYRRLLARPKPVQGESRREGQRRRKAGGEAPPLPVPELPKPTDLLFPGNHIKLFNNLLDRTNLKFDRDGKPRTAYSLRHTYICMRLMEGADIYQVAKNCRTSVEMIEKHYAIHLKNTLDASAINVLKAKMKLKRKKKPAKNADDQEP